MRHARKPPAVLAMEREWAERRANARGWDRVRVWWIDNKGRLIWWFIAIGFCTEVVLRGFDII